MKKLMIFFVMMVFMVAAFAQATEPPVEQAQTVWQIFAANWAELLLGLLAFVKIVIRLTPTLKDDKVFGWLDSLVAFFIPNMGGKSAYPKDT